MKVAILSDIHANFDALFCVLKEAKRLEVKFLIIAGDFVGYYYDICKVLDALDDWEFTAIGGNHETLLADWLNNENQKATLKKYGSGVKIASEQLSKKQQQWLINLHKKKEFLIENRAILLCHGSPWDENEYIYPDCKQAKLDAIFSLQHDITIYGHTHYPIVHRYQNQLIVNPGSVGQTRDRKSGACWALWDTKLNTIELMRTFYNTKELIKQCQANDPYLLYLQTALTRTNEN